jgi:D-beta-D-heptose 7-phosphate kinase/D-beta-D-heptose 1-phosphate adenosyltransferase
MIDRLGDARILVLGDSILDRYTWGNAERISPEAPVMVLRADEREVRLGGAASVAMLLRGLGADVTLASVVGDNSGGRVLRRLLDDAGIGAELVLTDGDRPTTVKERLLGRAANRQPHQVLRVDSETREPLGTELEKRLVDGVGREMAGSGCGMGIGRNGRTG